MPTMQNVKSATFPAGSPTMTLLCSLLSPLLLLLHNLYSCFMWDDVYLSHWVNHAQAGAGAEGTCSLSVVTMKGLRYRCCCRDPTAHGPSTITASDRQQQAVLLLAVVALLLSELKSHDWSWRLDAANSSTVFHCLSDSSVSWSGRKRENVGQSMKCLIKMQKIVQKEN